MVNSVEGLLQAQEHRSSQLILIHIFVHRVNKTQYTGTGGVALPEPELGLRQYVVLIYMLI